MKADPTPAETLEQNLKTILASEQFPVRGWVLKYSTAMTDPLKRQKTWPVYAVPPRINQAGEIQGIPIIAFYLPSTYVTLEARFEIPAEQTLFMGKLYTFAKEIVDKQVAFFLDRKGMMSITLDTKPSHIYKTVCILPEFHAYRDRVEEWAVKFKSAEAPLDRKHAAYMLTQLKAIKENMHQEIKTRIAELGNQVRQSNADYFSLLEAVMMGVVLPSDPALTKTGGVLTVATTEHYQPPPKLTVQ